jgi:4-hydroxybenzoate polyprenyltransferase
MSATPAAGPLHAARLIAADIKLHHSVFAMPFAVLAAFMAAVPPGAGPDWPRLAGQLALVVAAMVAARSVAMIANRLLDREIDAANPRTAGRAIPSGRLGPRAAAAALLGCAAGFAAVCAGFGLCDGNWWPLALAAPVLLWLGAYPLLKRFTSLCHLYLGASLAMSPLAAALAVDPPALARQPALWLLAGMVTCWVAGFDIIYALQDLEVDRRQGHHSIPARLGARGAVVLSRILHAGALGFLAAAAAVDPRFGVLFALGVGGVGLLLLYEHLTVRRWGTTRLAMAFFTLNGAVSCLMGLLGVADVLLS